MGIVKELVLPTHSEPSSDTEAIVERVRVIYLKTEPDRGPGMVCCGKQSEHRQINYEIIVQDRCFLFPSIWADVCSGCGEAYFASPVGSAMLDRMYGGEPWIADGEPPRSE